MKLVLVPFLVTVALVGSAMSVSAQSELSATLSGANEVPAVATIGFGSATFDVNLSGGVLGLSFELNVVNVIDAHMGHIHCGMPGENGPVVIWLAGQPAAPATAGYDLNGLWVKAKVTESSVVKGTPCGDTLIDVIIAMANGRTYANVHTRAHPGGEIRGQIQPVGPFTSP